MAFSRIIALIVLILGLNACDPTDSFERASNGPTIYPEELSDAAKAAARDKIVRSLNQGVSVYRLAIGDDVEIFFHANRKPTSKVYVIAPADRLRIDFLGDTDNSRTVEVAPDGRIDMPLIGSVLAAGRDADALARELQARYSRLLTEPKITVNVTGTHTPLDDLIDVLGSNGRSIVDKVLPDGTISLPLLAPLAAAGRTLADLQHAVDAAYSAKSLQIFVSLVPHTIHANTTLVIGEVGKPGQIELDRPTTVLMAVAQAGGVIKTGSMSAVRLYYVGANGVQHMRQINLDHVLGNLALEDDMIVPPNSIIYVPPTELAKVSRFLDATLRDILRYQGFGVGAGFQVLPQQQQNSTIIFPAVPAAR